MARGADRLNLLHVDNRLMRKDESRAVMEVFREFGLDRLQLDQEPAPDALQIVYRLRPEMLAAHRPPFQGMSQVPTWLTLSNRGLLWTGPIRVVQGF
jgi:hypothetical protein